MSGNIHRWHALQAERKAAELGPVMVRVQVLRDAGRTMTDILVIVNEEGFTSRTGMSWSYPALTQAYYKWRKAAV